MLTDMLYVFLCLKHLLMCIYPCAHRDESIHPYCERVKTTGLRTECTQQRDAVALCNLIDYGKSVPAQYQVKYHS